MKRIPDFFLAAIIIFLITFCGKGGLNGSLEDSGDGDKAPFSGKPSPSVAVTVSFNYRHFPLEVRIYEPSAGRPLELWETGVRKFRDALPVSRRVPDSTIHLEPGGKKMFVLVVENTTDDTQYFFATPHHVKPEEHSLGFKFHCLCVNHAFTVGPGEFWYRIVLFRLSPDFVGDKMTITHTLVGITRDRMEKFAPQN